MSSRLNRGKKNNKGKRKALHRCDCTQCGSPGEWLALDEWNNHRSRERKQRAINQMIEDGTLPPPAAIDGLPDEPDSGDVSPHIDQHSSSSLFTSLQAQKSVPDVTELTKKWSLDIIRQVEERLTEYAGLDFDRLPLVFLETPDRKDSFREDALVLDESSPLNTIVLGHEKWLQHHSLLFRDLTQRYQHDRRMALQTSKIKKKLERQLELLVRKKRLEWKRQCTAFSKAGDHLVDSRAFIAHPLSASPPITTLFYVLIAVLHLLSGVSYSACRFFIFGFKLALRLSSSETTDTFLTSEFDELPNRVEDMIRFMALEPRAQSFVCCPKCFYTYDQDSSFPDACTNVQRPGEDKCGRRLRANGRGNKLKPVREYLMQDFGEWLARLYARPNMEEVLDRRLGSTSSMIMEDIWDAPVLKDFKDPDGKPFFGGYTAESRLAFSLNMDGFNPLTNKQAGKKISTCGIYLVCFNLPPEIRYRPENIFLVGVIPGPTEPSLHQINYILKPLIDDFLILWNKGLYLMRTPRHTSGRRIKAAIIPLVCDLPAARQMAGMASHASNFFCSECYIQKQSIENLDSSGWPLRSAAEHRKAALQWLNTSTSKQQQQQYSTTGIRWSELLRLPYWDPTQYIVIDPMHCFYLGLFRRHVIDVWRMDAYSPDGDGLNFRSQKVATEEEMVRARNVFSTGGNLKKLQKHVLSALCWELGLKYVGRKPVLVKYLQSQRTSDDDPELGSDDDPDPPPAPKADKTSVLGKSTLFEVRRDLERIQLPSWVPYAPAHPGEGKWGKLTADQWRSLCTIILPITLTRLWGGKPKEDRKYKMLQNFLHLVASVKTTSMRRTSSELADDYEFHIRAYLKTLLQLFPGTELTPYQHMALHIGDQLRRFGPTHSWRCFAFERFNHIFQTIETNNIYGEMEKTMFKRFCMMQNLRTTLNDVTLPPTIHDIVEEFDKSFGSNVRGTLASDQFVGVRLRQKEETAPLTKEVRDLFLARFPKSTLKAGTSPRTVRIHRQLEHRGYTFALASFSAKDSSVMFQSPQDKMKTLIGSVNTIFSFLPDKNSGSPQEKEIYLVVKKYSRVAEGPHSAIFQEFRSVLGGLYSSDSPMTALVRLDEVDGQFCKVETDYGKNIFQAVPMNKE